MTTFDEREDRFENEFIHNAELRFKVEARRNKLLGLWLAEKMGLTGDDATRYAGEVVRADLEEPGEEDVIRKVMADIAEKGTGVSELEVREKLAELLPEAKRQIREGA